jgi:predicted flap endonuclease-1-like 5' DNA nuclease/uncharacterized membrane-anchored protein YhcB (DUF1043 family)
MAWFAGQSLVALAFAFVLGIVVGWLIWARRTDPDTSPQAAARLRSDLDEAQRDLVTTQKQLDDCRALTMTGPRHLATSSPELDPSVVDTISREARPAALVATEAHDDWDEQAEELEITASSATRAAVQTEEPDDAAPADDPDETADAGSTQTPDDETSTTETTSSADAPVDETETDEADEVDTAEATGRTDAPVDETKTDEPSAPDADDEVEAEAVPDAGTTPTPDDDGEPADAPAEDQDTTSEQDKIERIDGIGPKIGGALRAAGLGRFEAIADADDAALRAAIEAGGVTFAPSLTTWARQARLLADGDEDGFAALTATLVAGRDNG